jgi:hypothetical protein
MNDYGHIPRIRSIDQLEAMPLAQLHELMELCDIEPADPNICDACAAYLVASDRGDIRQ